MFLLNSQHFLTLTGRRVSIYNQPQQLMRASPSAWIIFNIIWVQNLFLYIGLCQGENKTLLILDIDDQNTVYVFAYKVTQVA